MSPETSRRATGRRAATIPPENLGPGSTDVAGHAAVLDEVSPGTHRIDGRGGLVSVATDGVPGVDAAVATLRATGLALLPSISNRFGGRRSRDAVSGVLHDPERTGKHVTAICDLVVGEDYAGIDVDYQGLDARDRHPFTRFVVRLADALHEQDRRLAVTVYATAEERPDEPASLVGDYAALGAVVDELRLSTWDYHDPTTAPGPPAPVGWVRDVLARATGQVPPDTLLLGVAGSGYDWSRDGAVALGHADAVRLAVEHAGGAIEVDPLGATPWFRYLDPRGAAHEVWFEDAGSVAAKIGAAAGLGVRGVLLWLSAPPDDGVWAALATPH